MKKRRVGAQPHMCTYVFSVQLRESTCTCSDKCQGCVVYLFVYYYDEPSDNRCLDMINNASFLFHHARLDAAPYIIEQRPSVLASD